jgi:hypothetical protein
LEAWNQKTKILAVCQVVLPDFEQLEDGYPSMKKVQLWGFWGFTGDFARDVSLHTFRCKSLQKVYTLSIPIFGLP